MRNRRRGIALITSVIVLALLMVLLAGFAAVVQSDIAVTENFGGLTSARWAARSGVYQAEYAIEQGISAGDKTLGNRTQLASEDDGNKSDEAAYITVIQDEAAKININTASREILQALFPAEAVDAILDWRDEDDTPEPLGAEDSYYTTLETPYHCKNGNFSTVRELLLVKGVTREVLETEVADGVRLEDVLTVWSVDGNTDAAGQPRVNLKTASQDELTTILQGISAEQVTALMQQRASFESVANLLNVPGITRQQVMDAFDRLTVTTTKELPGLVNINTAPAEVLAALPGMDESLAAAIIQNRDEQGPFSDVGQLLRLEAISNAVFQRIADLLTTRSKIYGVHSSGQLPNGISSAITAVLRYETTGEPRFYTLYWREGPEENPTLPSAEGTNEGSE